MFSPKDRKFSPDVEASLEAAFREECANAGLNPNDQEYGSLTLLARMFFSSGVEAMSKEIG